MVGHSKESNWSELLKQTETEAARAPEAVTALAASAAFAAVLLAYRAASVGCLAIFPRSASASEMAWPAGLSLFPRIPLIPQIPRTRSPGCWAAEKSFAPRRAQIGRAHV